MYCKNCKVKLTSNKCPLCGYELDNDNTNESYANTIEKLPYNIGLIYFSRIVILVLVISTIITMIINYAINKELTWSLIVIGSSIYISTHHFYLNMENKSIAFVINVFTLELLLGIIAYLTSLNWYLYLVMPLILCVAFNFLIYLYISRSNNIMRNMSYYLFLIGLFLIEVNGIERLFNTKHLYLTWSKPFSITIIIISLIMFLLSFNKKIREEVNKRFFV
jgi:hypothetical protein